MSWHSLPHAKLLEVLSLSLSRSSGVRLSNASRDLCLSHRGTTAIDRDMQVVIVMRRNFEKVGEREEALDDLEAKAKALEKVRVLCDATTRVNCFTAHTFFWRALRC